MSVRGEGKEKVGPKTWSVFHLTFRHLLVNKSCSPVVDALMANIQLSLENSLDVKVFPADCQCCAMSPTTVFFATAYNLCCSYFYFIFSKNKATTCGENNRRSG